MASFATEPPPAIPDAKARRRAGAFISLFVLFQFVAPLSYLGREDSSDERFTWRRFTGASAPACDTEAWLEQADGKRRSLVLESLLPEEWVGYVRNDWRAVVDAFLEQQCTQTGAERVDLINHCGDARGTREYSLQCDGGTSPPALRTATR